MVQNVTDKMVINPASTLTPFRFLCVFITNVI